MTHNLSVHRTLRDKAAQRPVTSTLGLDIVSIDVKQFIPPIRSHSRRIFCDDGNLGGDGEKGPHVSSSPAMVVEVIISVELHHYRGCVVIYLCVRVPESATTSLPLHLARSG